MEHFVGMMFVQRLRTPTDRQAVHGIFERVWGRPLRPEERPSLSVTPSTVRAGRAILLRVDSAAASGSSAEGVSQGAAASLRLLGSQLRPLEAALQVGPPSPRPHQAAPTATWHPAQARGGVSPLPSILHTLQRCHHLIVVYAL